MMTGSNLPDDIDALKAMILASQAEIAQRDALVADRDAVIERKEDCIQRLEKLVADFKRALFGARSEKASPEQFELALEDIETAMAAVHAEDEALDPPAPPTAKPRKTNRGSLPKHLPRFEEVIAPDSTICGCGSERHVIGEDNTERLDIIPAQFRVIVTRRPKYACRSCTDGIVQAPAPARLIPGGMPTEATVAHVLVSKYADHLPLYRQAQIYSRQGVDLDRSTLAGWVGKAAYELRPVFDALMADLKQSTKLFMDETRAPVLDPGKRKTKTGYFWALARDDRSWGGTAPPGVAFTYAPGRSGQYADDILKSFSGILQVDGYAGYNRLLKRTSGSVALAYCWAHARRKLHEVAQSGTAPIAEEGLKQIAALYRIEKDIRGLTAEARLAARQDRSAPLIADFETWLTDNRARVSSKAPLGEALKYIAKYWDGLCMFLADGRIEMDSNAVERTIRPITLNRKNALFAGHDAGAANWGIIASLIETCKLNAVDPHAYLADTLTAIVNGHKQSDIDALLPWNYNRACRKGSAMSIIELKVTLEYIEPAVTRILQVPADIRLDRLHLTLQAAMGWTNSHLYMFEAEGTTWGLPDPDFGGDDLPANKTTLAGVLEDTGARTIRYIYDFGDSWEHMLQISKITDPTPGDLYPRLTDISGRCPPEDVGGFPGYEEFVEAMADPKHPEHANLKEWYGGG